MITRISSDVKDDLKIWNAFALTAGGGLTITHLHRDPPVTHFTFVPDAAGRPPPGSKD
jgi:hypothetical protein